MKENQTICENVACGLNKEWDQIAIYGYKGRSIIGKVTTSLFGKFVVHIFEMLIEMKLDLEL